MIRPAPAPPVASASTSGARALLALGYFGLIVLLVLPLLVTSVPPLLDYPNHLARAHILGALGSDPLLQRFYTVQYRPVPNLASDVFIPAAARIFGIYAAGRIFLALCIATTVLGVACLHRVLHGSWHWWALFAGFFAIHGAFIAGFMNFSLGVGLALLCAAGWIAARGWPHPARLALGCSFAVLLFFTHLFAVGFYGLVVAGYTLAVFLHTPSKTRWRWPNVAPWALLAGQFVLPAALILGGDQGHGDLLVRWALGTKVRGMFMPVMNHSLVLDGFTLVALATGLILLWRGSGLQFASSMSPALIACALLFLILPGFVAVAPQPGQLVWLVAVAERFPILAVPLLIAAVRPVTVNRRVMLSAGMAFAALFLVRQTVLVRTWADFDRFIADVHAALRTVPRGSIVDSAIPYAELEKARRDRPRHLPLWAMSSISLPNLLHIAPLAVIERSAFVPTMFKDPSKQPLGTTRGFRAFDLRRNPLEVKRLVVNGKDGVPRLSPLVTRVDYLLVFYADLWRSREILRMPRVSVAYRGRYIVLLKLPGKGREAARHQ